MENITKEKLIDFVKDIANLWDGGKLSSPIHLSGGNEDQLIEIFKEVEKGDWVFSTHRSQYHYLLAGGSPEVLKQKILDGKSMHIFDKNLNFFTSSIVAGCAAIAAGVALALKKKNSKKHVWCFIGDGAEDEGHFYEAVRYVDGWDLPCTFVVEDNDRSVATPKKDRYIKEMIWPKCVRRHNYKAVYPHYDTGKWVDLSNVKFKEWTVHKKYSPEPFLNNEKIDLAYGEAIKSSMETLAKDPKTIFIGYNIKYGTKGYGTFTNISQEQLLETPLAENLMGGLAIGLALEGFKPVLFFERQDFMLVALDSLVNHLDKLEEMSEGQFIAPVIIRATVGAKAPLYPGPQHVQDFTGIFKELFSFPVYEPKNSSEVIEIYKKLSIFDRPTMIIERKELYKNKMEPKPLQADNQKLILDGHKLSWHKDRVDAWLRGERIAPITVDCALTRRCNYKCVYCYGKLQANDEKKMTKEVIFRFLSDAAEIGVKGISFMSDGESMCSPHIYDSIVYGKSKGLDIGFATNGAILKKERFKEILPCLTWLRFNISAGEQKRYAEIHGCREEDFLKVKEIIKECVKIKKDNNLGVTIGLQMVLLPEFVDQIMPLAKLGKELGVDYLVIKHCSDDENRTLGIDYDKYFNKELLEEIKKAENLSEGQYAVKAKWSKILSGGKRVYSRCYGPPFIIQLSGSGLVAPCGMLFNDKYKKFHIGNIAEKSFKEIWKSDRYWEVMDLIASDKFDARTDCGTLCLQHKVNEYLWDLKQGNTKLEEPQGELPQHINFI